MAGSGRKSPDYEVGYCRPPVEKQFAAGNRANPNGRPRGSRSVGAVLDHIMRQKIAVSEHGKTRRIPTLEVILRRLANDAMRSDPAAVKLLISLVDRYAESTAAAPRLNDLLAEDRAILARYLQTRLLRILENPMKQNTTTSLAARRFEALLRADFRPFLEKAFNTLSPGQIFIPAWHLGAIAYQLERIRCSEIKRLIINMPPRSLKSVTASVAFPAYLLGHDPTRRIICVSYSGDLAKKHANDFRAVAEAPWYRDLFPGTRIGQKDSESEIELTARGFRFATSVGGTLTGRGGDLIIIDDPLKPDDAYSETKRNACNEWYKNTLLSRLDDKRTGAIVIVMQRACRLRDQPIR
jgi:hypothetical protein